MLRTISSGCSFSDSAMPQRCLANLILNCKSLIEFLISNSKEFHNVENEKNKDLLRFVMLVVVEAMFDTNERLSR